MTKRKLIDVDALLAGLYDENPKDVALYIANFPEAQLSGEGTTNQTTGTTCGTTDDCISRQAAIEAIEEMQMPIMRSQIENEQFVFKGMGEALQAIKDLPSAQERKKDIIQKFHDYQIEWLKSHYDIVLEPQLEELIVRFLHDTANSYMMEEK